MKRISRWFFGFAVFLVLLLPILGHSLPVKQTSGWVNLTVRPRPFTDSFYVEFAPPPFGEAGLVLVTCKGGSTVGPALAGGKYSATISATPTDAPLGFQRTEIECLGTKQEVWIFNVGPHTFAIK